MPKLIHTRKQKAKKLLERLEEGPAFIDSFSKPFDKQAAEHLYRIWAQCWIIPVVKELIKELNEEA